MKIITLIKENEKDSLESLIYEKLCKIALMENEIAKNNELGGIKYFFIKNMHEIEKVILEKQFNLLGLWLVEKNINVEYI